MNTAPQIVRAVTALGGRIEPAGDRLRTLLPAKSANLPPDCAPWLHIARQVLAGEFDDADHCLVESLTIGLRATRYPDCQQALARLNI